MVLLLSQADVRHLLTMEDVIRAVSDAHVALARQEVIMPVRLTMRYDDRPSELEAMPAFIRSMPALGMKLIDYVGTNTQRGLPAIHALIVVLDADDGRPLAILEGSHVTATRTAAASAVATSLLAREAGRVLAIVGAGVQAGSHLEAMLHVRPFERILICGRDRARLSRFVDESRARYPGVAIGEAATVREAVADADVIVTATTSPTPVLWWDWLKPGAHINAIGSHSPDTRELATDVVVRARRFVDSREANLKECGDFLIAIAEGALAPEDIDTEIGQVAAGLRPGRTCDEEITLYKSGGIAVQDVATADLVYRLAVARGVGTRFAF
jgi:ornithine cyclodeaminase/alanine dehydrogenase-like protein (mu-crystallin family)